MLQVHSKSLFQQSYFILTINCKTHESFASTHSFKARVASSQSAHQKRTSKQPACRPTWGVGRVASPRRRGHAIFNNTTTLCMSGKRTDDAPIVGTLALYAGCCRWFARCAIVLTFRRHILTCWFKFQIICKIIN